MNYLDKFIGSNNASIEIAILDEDINSQNPGYANFKIPILVSDNNNETIYINNNNIINKNKVSSIGITTIDNVIKLYVPKEYTMFYGDEIVPKGTRFIICFIGGNLNDIKIIGRYDNKEE